MPCTYKKTVETVMATGSDLLVQLKGNHPTLQAAVHTFCQTHPHAEQAYELDLGKRNRIEQRTVKVWPLPAGTGSEPWHDHFQVVIEVQRRIECFNTRLRCFEPRQEPPAYYLATRNAGAQTLARAIRGHWGIENRLHHVLDTSLEEDASRIRQNPGVFALLRHFSLNLLRYNGQTNIRAALYNNAICLDRVLDYKGIKH
jgi:predicted transposase YbfD/YdcC